MSVLLSTSMKRVQLFGISCSELISKVRWNPHLILRAFGKMAGVLQCKLFTTDANACSFDLMRGVLFSCSQGGGKGEDVS